MNLDTQYHVPASSSPPLEDIDDDGDAMMQQSHPSPFAQITPALVDFRSPSPPVAPPPSGSSQPAVPLGAQPMQDHSQMVLQHLRQLAQTGVIKPVTQVAEPPYGGEVPVTRPSHLPQPSVPKPEQAQQMEQHRDTTSADEDEQHVEEGKRTEEDRTNNTVEEVKTEEDFNPTAEIVAYDVRANLVTPWDELQAEMAQQVHSFSEQVLSHAFQLVHEVSAGMYQLKEEARAELETGVKAIKDEEELHNSAVRKFKAFIEHMEKAKMFLQ